MGAVESCCGKRRPADMPSMPTKPVSALGNQYVTFNPEQPELFIMRQRIWSSHQPFDVKDIALNDWFKIEGKDAQVAARHPCLALRPPAAAGPARRTVLPGPRGLATLQAAARWRHGAFRRRGGSRCARGAVWMLCWRARGDPASVCLARRGCTRRSSRGCRGLPAAAWRGIGPPAAGRGGARWIVN